MKNNKNTIDEINKVGDFLESLSDSKDLYILFIDLCDSTSFKQFCLEKGISDTDWIFRQQLFLSRVATLVKKYSGTVIKTIGDEIMATFDINIDPITIINCCAEIFNQFNNLKAYKKEGYKIYSKAAVDFGNCFNGQILDLDIFDPIGTPVDRCARISKKSDKSCIVFSEDFLNVLKQTNPNFNFDLFESGIEDFKGLGKTNFYKMELK
jgi:class 3 adenylate cyclase